VKQESSGWITSRFRRLSTGGKLLLILSLALLPLGLISILASVESARQETADRADETLARLQIKAQRINTALSRAAITINTASAVIAGSPDASGACAATLRRLENGPGRGRYALFEGAGLVRCSSAGFSGPPSLPAGKPGSAHAEIEPGGELLRLYVHGDSGEISGIAEFPRSALSEMTYLPGTTRNFDLEIHDGNRRMVLRDSYQAGALVWTVRGSEPIADGKMQLVIALSAQPFSFAEILMILLPVLMWLAAAVIGWFIVDRLLLRPLARMQRAVAAYRPGDRELDLPALATPAREIGELGQAFDQVVKTVARHEADLEAAVERQTRLVREVHHRVKNNLQVVASLLNIHSRGSPNEEVAAAYASIQRRVDALAVVHRNHYAELEESRGVALKPLISELAANLRATAPPSASSMMIRLDLEPYYVTQDVAVSVAFLITEMAEYAMFCGATVLTVQLAGAGRADAARLNVESDTLKAEAGCDPILTDRFERIVTGLSRQLRSSVERDSETGRYSLDIAVVEKAERG
jgi:two-component sensor histidine kinase